MRDQEKIQAMGLEKEFNQVTQLQRELAARDETIRSLKSECLELYRRLYAGDRPTDSPD